MNTFQTQSAVTFKNEEGQSFPASERIITTDHPDARYTYCYVIKPRSLGATKLYMPVARLIKVDLDTMIGQQIVTDEVYDVRSNYYMETRDSAGKPVTCLVRDIKLDKIVQRNKRVSR